MAQVGHNPVRHKPLFAYAVPMVVKNDARAGVVARRKLSNLRADGLPVLKDRGSGGGAYGALSVDGLKAYCAIVEFDPEFAVPAL